MRPIEDIRLVNSISNRIYELLEQYRSGELDDVDDGDLAGICMAMAMRFIEEVRGNDKKKGLL